MATRIAWNQAITLGLCLIVAACGDSTGPSGPSGSGGSPPSTLTFNFEGTSHVIAKALARVESQGEQGLVVYFVTEQSQSCATVGRSVPGAWAFYPDAGSTAYGQPVRVGFWMNFRSSSESRSPPYPGGITLFDVGSRTVKGWVRATGVGEYEDSSLNVTFTAQLCV
jgi:hypothetical protein